MIHAPSRVSVCLGLALVACLAVAAPAPAAQPSSTGLSFSLRLRNSGEEFLGRLIRNCQLFEGAGWELPETTTRYTYATASGSSVGVLDVKARSGAAYVKSGGLQVEQIFGPGSPHAIQFADLGVALDGGRMYLVGRIKRGQPQTAAAQRVRLAVVRRPKFEHGLLFDARGKVRLPSTFSFFVSGKLTMLPAIVRAFERTRCKGRRYSSRPWRVGYEIGLLDVSVRPDVAVGLEGTSKITFDVVDIDTGAPITIEPGAGASRASAGVLTAPLPGGLPLACLAGAYCSPASGSVALPAFDMVYNGRRAAVTNVMVSSTRTAPDAVQQTVTAVVDGAPVTVADGPRYLEPGPVRRATVTPEFIQRAREALGGTSIAGDLRIEFLFTRTGPA